MPFTILVIIIKLYYKAKNSTILRQKENGMNEKNIFLQALSENTRSQQNKINLVNQIYDQHLCNMYQIFRIICYTWSLHQ